MAALRLGFAKGDIFQKIDCFIPVASKAIYYAVTGARAKMLGKTYVDVLNLLHYEFTLPETEESWKKRQDLISQLSEILENRRDNVPVPKDFVDRVKLNLPYIVGAAASERTTLSSQACRLLTNIAKNLETQIQDKLDILLPPLIAHCGSTKNVNQKNANDAIVSICKHVGYNPRLFYHVCSSFREKRIPPRIYAPEWLRLLISTYRAQMDRDRDGEAARKAIFEGLTDGQVKVRENSRAAYWEYATYDLPGSRMIMGGLNSHAQAALRADPNNPDKSAAKAAKVPRPDSALAAIRAQSKQRMQQHRGFTPASLQPEDFKQFGSMEDVDKPDPPPGAKNTTRYPQEKHSKEASHSSHHSESSSGSRQGLPTQSRQITQKSAKESRYDSTKDAQASSPQVDARPLLSAPVRRGRIVATPMAPIAHQSQRPGSRGEATTTSATTKKSVDIKDKSTTDKFSGRQTPVRPREKESSTSIAAHHRKNASRHDPKRADEKESYAAAAGDGQQSKKNGRQTPVIPEDKGSSPVKRAERPSPGAAISKEISPVKKHVQPAPALVEEEASPAPACGQLVKEDTASEHLDQLDAEAGLVPQRPVMAFALENQVVLPPPVERPAEKTLGLQHVPDGKENTHVIRPRKKRSPQASPSRSPNRSPQRSPRRNSIASAKKSLSTAIEFLRHGTLDALGYRRLRKLIETHPRMLITRQAQYNELFELLISNMTSLDEISESREKRNVLNHPAYNRHTILIILIDLFQQYPQWPEPHPGMTLCALLIARCNHSSGYISVLQAIDDSAYLLCTSSQNPLPTIDAVLETLEQIEHIITTNDPIVTPNSTTTIFHNSLQSLASDFGPERPRFATRLPIIMAFGLKILNALLARLVSCNQTLYSIQEDRLASFAEHLLATYTSIIKRGVMDYCVALHNVIKPEKRFYNYFSKESDRNLIHYYVAGASGMVYGSLGHTGRVVVPESSQSQTQSQSQSTSDDYLDSLSGLEPATVPVPVPGSGTTAVSSEASANWKVLGTTIRERALAAVPRGMDLSNFGIENAPDGRQGGDGGSVEDSPTW